MARVHKNIQMRLFCDTFSPNFKKFFKSYRITLWFLDRLYCPVTIIMAMSSIEEKYIFGRWVELSLQPIYNVGLRQQYFAITTCYNTIQIFIPKFLLKFSDISNDSMQWHSNHSHSFILEDLLLTWWGN